jgi:polyphosphate kinase
MTLIRRLLRLPPVQLAFYYAGLVLVALLLTRLFPSLRQAFEFSLLQAAPDASQLLNPSTAPGGFLSHPNVGARTLFATLGAVTLVAPIAWVYMVTKHEVRYDQSLVHTILMLPIAVTGIVIIVQWSLPLAFSLAGIVAAVRFRNTLQDTKDAVYIFLAIGVGLAAGVEALPIAFVISATFNFLVLTLWRFEVGSIYSGEQTATLPAKPSKKAKPKSLPSRKRGSMMFDASQLLEPAPKATQAAAASASVLNPELSLLDFHTRVLALAEDPTVPLLARIRFLSIFSSNLDEFFMVRVGGLKQAVAEGITRRSIDGQTPGELLQAINVKLRALVRRQYRCVRTLLSDQLPAEQIRVRRLPDLNDHEQEYLKDFFDDRILPLLTPRAITLAGGHPAPFIEDLRISVAVMVRDPRTGRDHFGDLDISDALPRFIQLPETTDFVPIEEAVRANIAELYPGRHVLEVHPFRVTRSSEVKFDEKHAANFLEALEEELMHRPRGAIVRIEVERSMPYPIRDLLLRELRREVENTGTPLQASDIYEAEDLVDVRALEQLTEIPRPELDYPAFTPAHPVAADRSMFDVLDERDLLVHHPYESYEATTERLITEAAADPDVVSMKMTLYRPGGPSRCTESLMEAAAAGKDVSVFVEIKARFDEELNIFWAKQLERRGIHVVTGLVKYKTHAKLLLIVRRQGDRVRRYAHIGTGNYNAETACQYTDLGLLTTDAGLCGDVNHLFNELTGSSRAPAGDFPHSLVAPTNMLKRFIALIERETEHASAGRPAHIRVKMNGIADAEVIEALYRASQAGVQMDLVVRGICAVRPGVPGLSDNIRVVSALGRFLEHARIFHFANGGEPEHYIGSADWRPRNLRRRVEMVVPVTDADACHRLDGILETELADAHAWHLQSDGTYVQHPVPDGARSAQQEFLDRITGEAAPVAS